MNVVRDAGVVDFRVVHGYRRAFRMLGSGPPLLLVHGIGDSSDTWTPVLSALAERHTVIAPDLLGHGDSAKPRADYAIAAYACGMRDLLTVLGIDRVTVIGHSLGGGVAMQFAYQFPERCERVVLVASAGMGRSVHPVFRLASGPLAEAGLTALTTPAARLASRAVLPVLRRLGGLGLGHDLDYAYARYLAFGDPTARRAFLRTIRAGVDLTGQHITMLDRSYLAAGLPTLIAWGSRDGIIPARHATVAHAAFPGSRLEIFPDAGHFPHRDDPAHFVKLVEDFIDTTAPAPYDRDTWAAALRTGGTPPRESSGS